MTMVSIGMSTPTMATLHTMHRPGTHRGTGTSAQVGDCRSVGDTHPGITVGIHRRGIITITTIGAAITTIIMDTIYQEAGTVHSVAATAMQYTPTEEALLRAATFPAQTALHEHHRVSEPVELHASKEEQQHSRDARHAKHLT